MFVLGKRSSWNYVLWAICLGAFIFWANPFTDFSSEPSLGQPMKSCQQQYFCTFVLVVVTAAITINSQQAVKMLDPDGDPIESDSAELFLQLLRSMLDFCNRMLQLAQDSAQSVASFFVSSTEFVKLQIFRSFSGKLPRSKPDAGRSVSFAETVSPAPEVVPFLQCGEEVPAFRLVRDDDSIAPVTQKPRYYYQADPAPVPPPRTPPVHRYTLNAMHLPCSNASFLPFTEDDVDDFIIKCVYWCYGVLERTVSFIVTTVFTEMVNIQFSWRKQFPAFAQIIRGCRRFMDRALGNPFAMLKMIILP